MKMNKCRFWLIVLMLGVLVVFSVGASGETPELKVQKALGVTEAQDVHKIPVGSTVILLPDDSTTITGPDGKLVISAKSSEVGLISTPQGMAKATHVYNVPSGSFIHGASTNTVEVYDTDGRLILTVIDQTGEAGLKAAQIPDFTDWVEYARFGFPSHAQQRYSCFQAQWTVPTAPNNYWIDNDVVYLFNGIQGDGANAWAGRQAILQPVVGYNENGWVPGNPLNGRAWVVSSPLYFRSSAIGVAVGNVILGTIYLTNLGQPRWQAIIKNQSTGKYSVLTTDLLGTTHQFITTCLEGHNLETDSDLFGTTDFVNMQIWDINNRFVYPNWLGIIDPDAWNWFTDLAVIIHGFFHVELQTAR